MDGFLIFLIAAVVVAGVFTGIKSYNRLNPLREELHEGEENIEVCMHKVSDLAQKLAEIASSYGFHEKHILLQISHDRRKAQESVYQQSLQAITLITGYADTFPNLKADQTYLRLMDDLRGLSVEIQAKYEDYNRRAKTYNTLRTAFPTVLMSDMLGFSKASYLNPTRWYPRPVQKLRP